MSMPDGAMTRAPVSEARERLAASPFLLVDVELPEGAQPAGPSLVHLLGLEFADLAWLGQEGESARAEFLGDSAAFVVPAIEAGQVIHVHAVVTERYLLTVHRGAARLIGNLTARFPNERPPNAVAMLFLLLDEALETYRGAAVQALLDVEDLEDEMFRRRRPEQVYRLARLRRTAALLHHTLLPYHRVTDETVTRRMMSGSFPEERERLVREYQRTARLVLTDIESLQEASRRAFGSYSSLVSADQNGVINRLAIVSTIFLPLTFLTGFFGMNFAYLTDEIESGAVFWLLAVGLQVAFLAIALYTLHRTGLWRRLRDEEGGLDDE
ncbi:magnesium transporter CorA family protein [Streptomyces erythrochromogenes]|uniref:magnesium transporter CorA family protein n=1 Tax=Streptomyces erythrochromogenes TaxID=285574 RepID=UPI003700FC20